MSGRLLPFRRPRRSPWAPTSARRQVSAPLILACLGVFSLTVAAGLALPRLLDNATAPAVTSAAPAPAVAAPFAGPVGRAPQAGPTTPASAEPAPQESEPGPQLVVEAPRAGEAPLAGEMTRIVRVIDGDTVVIAGGEHVRILNIDTAEKPPLARCAEEVRLAQAAKVRLSTLVAGAEVVLVRDGRDHDRYGRLLRRLLVDGEDVGERLVAEGLAHRWVGHKLSWCD